MSNIKINDRVWSSISNSEQDGIEQHLLKHGVLKPGDSIVPDAGTAPPNPDAILHGATVGDFATAQAFAIPGWICRAGCDAAAAAAIAALTLTGPALAAALAAIAAAREACRNACP